jgi:hypothetical protein
MRNLNEHPIPTIILVFSKLIKNSNSLHFIQAILPLQITKMLSYEIYCVNKNSIERALFLRGIQEQFFP